MANKKQVKKADKVAELSVEDKPSFKVNVGNSPKKKFRLMFNPKQKASTQRYSTPYGEIVIPIFGYHFSMDKEMDKMIDYLESMGFKEN